MPRVIEDVHVNHEALIFRRGRIYPESFVTGSRNAAHYRRPSRYGWFLAKNYWLRRGQVKVPRGLWAIDNFSPDSYHHWMIDVLPRLLRAEESFPDEHTLLLPRYYGHQAYIAFTLPAFPQIERVGWIGARTKTRVQSLSFVPRQNAGDTFIGQIAEVARRLKELAGRPGQARRIYFSREDAAHRRARNEADVVRELRAHDFEIIHIDASAPWQQIRAASGASLMAGVHGAALTNVIFMRPGSQLLEFRHDRDDLFFDSYAPLARWLGIDYQRQTCAQAGTAEGLAANDLDLIVDLDVLRENLSDYESSSPSSSASP